MRFSAFIETLAAELKESEKIMKYELLLFSCVGLIALAVTAAAGEKNAAPPLNVKMETLDGKEVDLNKYRGKVVLVVNTASECGLTPQYEGLQALHEKYSKDGLAVIGFPCNQFGKQEPGTAKEIAEFCQQNYNVSFDMFAKVKVNDEGQCDLYKFLTNQKIRYFTPDGVKDDFNGKIAWNFEKFLIGRDGQVLARFHPRVDPESDELVEAISAELKGK